MLTDQINQVEQRIKNLQSSMNAELDSLLTQLQHLKDLTATAKPEETKRSELPKVSQYKVDLDTWRHIPAVLRVTDVQSIMGIGINQAYNLLKSRAFHHVKIGEQL